MKISILCSDPSHPINHFLVSWIERNSIEHQINLFRTKSELCGGDLLFLISCAEILTHKDRINYLKTLVLHASDLPLGRGWSPHIWQLIEGAEELTLSLLEAAEPVDSGDIWKKINLKIPKDALWDEINLLLFTAELSLMDFAVANMHQINPVKQAVDTLSTYYPKRTPKDSQLDPNKSLSELFNLIRVCDPNRFPAFFELHSHNYTIRLEKV